MKASTKMVLRDQGAQVVQALKRIGRALLGDADAVLDEIARRVQRHPGPAAELLRQFLRSLRMEQVHAIGMTLDREQLVVLTELFERCSDDEDGPGTPSGEGEAPSGGGAQPAAVAAEVPASPSDAGDSKEKDG
jgi:hypothetical protein